MKLTQLSRGRFGLCKDNNLPVGEIYREVDGFFVFWPYTVTGFYTEQFLREVADKLRELNKEWNETIEKEMKR